jgi:bifunctional UDP-N-acetylglucosamine pyrophosphorylase/glucosamine-1-phosphate N-acetyltransferase
MNVVILAAGMGKRMQSALPKVLHPLAGKPLLQHVIDTARSLKPSKLCVIYGHGGAAVPSAVHEWGTNAGITIDTALQQPQLGTGHAVMQALPQVDENAPTLVLYGDVPLTTSASCSAWSRRPATTSWHPDRGAGQSLRPGPHHPRERQDRAHRRRKGCDEEERAIKEINSGIMVIPTST